MDGGRGVEVARHRERAAHVLLVHPHVERPVAQEQPGRPADRAEGPGAGADASVGGSASSWVWRAVVDSRISVMRSSGVSSRRASTPCSVNRPIIPRTWGTSPISTSSCGRPASSASRWAVWAATARTSQPGRSVGVDHWSSATCSSTLVKESTAPHQSAMRAASRSRSVVVPASGLVAARRGISHGERVGTGPTSPGAAGSPRSAPVGPTLRGRSGPPTARAPHHSRRSRHGNRTRHPPARPRPDPALRDQGIPDSLQEVVDPTTVGWILVIAGVLALVLGLVMNKQRSRTTHVEERRDL